MHAIPRRANRPHTPFCWYYSNVNHVKFIIRLQTHSHRNAMRGNCATTATVLAFFLFFVLLESPTQLVIVSVVEGHHLSGQKKKFCTYDSSKQSIFRFLWTPELSQFGWQQFYDMREHWASFLIFHSVIASKTLIKWETIPNSINIRMHCGLNFDNNRKKNVKRVTRGNAWNVTQSNTKPQTQSQNGS